MTTPTPDHVTVTDLDDGGTTVACTKCQVSLTVGAMFGPIPGPALAETFATQHAHTKRTSR